MKLLYCESCGDILAPYRQNNIERWCACGRHAIWWTDGDSGTVRVHDVQGPTPQGPAGNNRAAWIVGIANTLLAAEPGFEKDPEFYSACLQAIPSNYLFKKMGSLIVRFRPGDTGDSGWAALPRKNETRTLH